MSRRVSDFEIKIIVILLHICGHLCILARRLPSPIDQVAIMPVQIILRWLTDLPITVRIRKT